MWLRGANILTYLDEFTGNKLLYWDNIKEQAFKALKVLMKSECVNRYPNYTKSFEIYKDVSNYQLSVTFI